MMNVLQVLMGFTALSFLIYGISCLRSEEMVAEFKRFGLPKWRKLTGWLQIVGGLGLLTGIFYPVVACVAALGLALLMFLGFLVRLKIKDGILVSLPSLVFMLLNVYLFYANLNLLD